MRLPVMAAMVMLAGPLVLRADILDEKLQALKDAVASRNAAQVKTLALEIFPLVTQAVCETPPDSESEKEAWKSRVDAAKGVGTYTEYALFTIGVASPPATLVDLIGILEQQNAKSEYLDAAYGPYLYALTQTGAGAKALPMAEKALANFPENEDLLLVVADSAYSRKQSDRALGYANRLVAVVSKHPRPEGTQAAQWEKKRNAELGRGYWMSGVIYGEKGQYSLADKNLRAALPLIQGNAPMLGAALFHLGMANYQLGKMTLSKARVLEGAKFSEQSAAVPGAYADQARHNALVMKGEADRMR